MKNGVIAVLEDEKKLSWDELGFGKREVSVHP